MDHTFTHRPSRHGPRAEDSQDDDVQFINEIDADIIFVSSFKRSGDSEYHPYIKRMKTLQTFLEITRQPPRKERKAPNEFRFATCVLCQKNFSKISDLISTRCGHLYCSGCYSCLQKAKQLCVGNECNKKKLTKKSIYKGFPN